LLRLALLAVLLAAFWLRLQALTRQDIWWDEARNIDVALRPLAQVATAPELDIQPPVYYWLLHGWDRLLGVTIGQPAALLAFANRLLSVFAGVIGVALLYALGRRTTGSLAGLLAAGVGACSPFWLAESQETRMYTTGFALLAGAAVSFLSAFGGVRAHATQVHRGRLVVFVLLAAAALLTHYNAVFILVAWYVWWGAWCLWQPDRWRQLGVAFLCGLAMTVLVLPVAPIALRQIPGYENPNITIPTIGDYLWQNWQAYIGGYAFDPTMLANNGALWLWAVLAVAGVGVLIALVTAWRAPKEAGLRAARLSQVATLSFLLAWLLGGLALYYIAVLDRNSFNVRYSSFVTPALYTLAGAGLAAYARWWRTLPVVALALVLVGLWPAAQADLYDSRFDREHMDEVAAWLHANNQPGDVIFVDQKYPFGFYYQPYTTDAAVDLPAGDTPPARYLFVDINTLDQDLNQWAKNANRVFWVQWFESDTDPRRAVHFLLDKVGRHAGEQVFQGYSIDWWDMQPPTTFALAPNLTPARFAFAPAVETVALSLPQGQRERLVAGGTLPVAIRWQRTAGGTIGRPLKARVALYDANEGRVAQADERLLNDRHRAPSQWQPADQPLNVYALALPAELAPGDYTVRLLVYDAETLEPLTLVDDAGNPAGQEATLGTLSISVP